MWAWVLAGCGGHPLQGYEWIGQIEGDTPIEQGPTVCGVARTRTMLHFLQHDTNRTCREAEYDGSRAITHRFSVAPFVATRDTVADEDPSLFLPTPRIRGWDTYLVSLQPGEGVTVQQSDGHRTLVARTTVHWFPERPLLDLAVDDGWAWVVDDSGELSGIELAAVASDPVRHAVQTVDGGTVALDVDGEQIAVVAGNRVSLWTRDGALVGRSEVADATLVGVALGVDSAHATTNGGQLLPLDLTDPAAPVWADPIETTGGGVVRLDDETLLTLPGFGAAADVIDVRNPRRPRVVRDLRHGNGIWDATFMGSVLYMATGAGGVNVYGPRRDYEAALDALEPLEPL
jgi:hypothetical protein